MLLGASHYCAATATLHLQSIKVIFSSHFWSQLPSPSRLCTPPPHSLGSCPDYLTWAVGRIFFFFLTLNDELVSVEFQRSCCFGYFLSGMLNFFPRVMAEVKGTMGGTSF